MQKELQNKLINQFPKIFNNINDNNHWPISCGISCGDGWFNLLWQLCEKLDVLINQLPENTQKQFEVHQIKEKFGQLRFYTSFGNDDIYKAITEAEELSGKICEECGEPGKSCTIRGWVRTLCENHKLITEKNFGK